VVSIELLEVTELVPSRLLQIIGCCRYGFAVDLTFAGGTSQIAAAQIQQVMRTDFQSSTGKIVLFTAVGAPVRSAISVYQSRVTAEKKDCFKNRHKPKEKFSAFSER
jgi:uncharacterized paraquat-inducible protein A